MEMRGLPISVLGNRADHLSRSQAPDSGLPARHRDLRQRRQRPRCAATGRDLDCQYKTAFVLAHKLREAMGSEVHNPDLPELSGAVAVDGAYFGGKVRRANRKADRTDRRSAEERIGKRQVVVVAREVLGRTLPFIVPRESAAVPMIRQNVASGTTVHADESGA
jgi:hypothetical protein